MKQYTDITVLLDRSGSMEAIREAMEGSFNEFINKHKEVPSTRISLIQFDDINSQQVVYQGVPVADAPKLTLKPRGNTPLIDAFCEAIDRTGERLSEMNEADRPDQVLFVVITDGQENSSRKFKRYDVSNRVNKQREHYKWQFVYLGANQDAIKEAASYGIPQQWALNYAHTQGGVAGASQSLISNTVAYAAEQGRNRGLQVKEFDSTQRKQAIEDTRQSGNV